MSERCDIIRELCRGKACLDVGTVGDVERPPEVPHHDAGPGGRAPVECEPAIGRDLEEVFRAHARAIAAAPSLEDVVKVNSTSFLRIHFSPG